MTDGAQQAGQDTFPALHNLCIKNWTRTHPQAPGDSHVHEQYTSYLDHLESGESVVKHSADFLAVSRATTASDFRWLSTAKKLSNSDVTKYILARRSDFILQSESSDEVFELEELVEFNNVSGSTDTRSPLHETPRRTATDIRPLHVYGRKSTASRGQVSPYVRPKAALIAFRRLLDSPSSQESSRDSIHSSTPRTTRRRVPLIVDSPEVSAAFDHTSEASSLSPSPSPPIVRSKVKLVHHEIKRVKLDHEVKGRQPLRLQATTSAIPRQGQDRHSAALKKSKLTLRPITRKIPANGIPLETRVPLHKAMDRVFSHARTLQGFGGSWPLKGREDVVGHITEGEMGGDTTEIIEDYTIQLGASSSSPVRPALQGVEAINLARHTRTTLVHSKTTNNIAASSALAIDGLDSVHCMCPEEDYQLDNGVGLVQSPSLLDAMPFFQSHAALNPATTLDAPARANDSCAAPLRSTNLPEPPSPPNVADDTASLPLPILQLNEIEKDGGDSSLLSPPCAQTRVYQREVPEISVTLPTSPTGSSHPARASMPAPLPTAKTKDTPTATTTIPSEQEGNAITIDEFLSLAFGPHNGPSTGGYLRHMLPSRCVPRFRTLSSAIPSRPIAQVFVADETLHGGGIFRGGYLGPGRRGFWDLPLTIKQPPSQLHKASQGIILGLKNCSVEVDLRPSPIVWTLQRLRYFLARLQALARLGKFGVLTVSTTGLGGAESIQVSCQASMALMMRTVFNELACPLDKEGNEVCEPSEGTNFPGRSRLGDKWLSAKAGIRLAWWDEIERCPVLFS